VTPQRKRKTVMTMVISFVLRCKELIALLVSRVHDLTREVSYRVVYVFKLGLADPQVWRGDAIEATDVRSNALTELLRIGDNMSTTSFRRVFWGEQRDFAPPPSLSQNAKHVLKGNDGRLNTASATACTVRKPTTAAISRRGFCLTPRIKAKGASLYDRKTTSSLDETARSECTNEGVHLWCRFRRVVDSIREINRRMHYSAVVNGAAAARGLL
jgi:hypothetical protein